VAEGRDSQAETSLSLTSLIVGSLSSAAAAVVVHEWWRPGTIGAAALTPVLMALFAEALRRPAERLTVRTGGRGKVSHETTEVFRPPRRWGQAVVGGLVAFVLGAAGLTIAEAVLHRAINDRDAGSTLFDSGRRQAPPGSGPATPTATPIREPVTPTAEPTRRGGRATGERRDQSVAPADRPERTPIPTSSAGPTPTPTWTPGPPTPTPSP
jgi:hypothetical protein